jgi:hypothetical protein
LKAGECFWSDILLVLQRVDYQPDLVPDGMKNAEKAHVFKYSHFIEMVETGPSGTYG